MDAGVPSGVSATDAAKVVYTWNFAGNAVMSGTGLRRYVVTFQSAGSFAATVTATLGGTKVGTATTTLTVK